MTNDYEEKRRKTSSTLRSIYDYVMGVLWLSLGIVFIWHDKFGFDLDFDPARVPQRDAWLARLQGAGAAVAPGPPTLLR